MALLNMSISRTNVRKSAAGDRVCKVNSLISMTIDQEEAIHLKSFKDYNEKHESGQVELCAAIEKLLPTAVRKAITANSIEYQETGIPYNCYHIAVDGETIFDQSDDMDLQPVVDEEEPAHTTPE